MEKVTSKNTKRALRNRNSSKTSVLLCFCCRIMLLTLHIALICNTTLKLWSGAFQTRTVTSSVHWLTRNSRRDSGKRRSQPKEFDDTLIVDMRLEQRIP